MTWALCITAWFVLSIPCGCLAVRLIPSVPRDVGTSVPPNQLNARRSTPKLQAPGVFSDRLMAKEIVP